MTALHDTHVCRDCGASIRIPYALPATPPAEADERVAALREALKRCAEDMHDYAVGGESEEGFLHTTTPWTECPGPECVAARAALDAAPEDGSAVRSAVGVPPDSPEPEI